jgi:hypothetical protein
MCRIEDFIKKKFSLIKIIFYRYFIFFTPLITFNTSRDPVFCTQHNLRDSDLFFDNRFFLSREYRVLKLRSYYKFPYNHILLRSKCFSKFRFEVH